MSDEYAADSEQILLYAADSEQILFILLHHLIKSVCRGLIRRLNHSHR